jgi:chromosome segregation ATPase
LERKIAEEKPDNIDSAFALRENNVGPARRAGERSSLEQKLAESEKTAAVLREANRFLSEGLKTIEKELADIEGKQALLIKEKKGAVREKLEAVKDAGVVKDRLISLDKENQELKRRMQSLKAELSNLHAVSKKPVVGKEAVRKDRAGGKSAGAGIPGLKEEISRLQILLKQLTGDYAALKAAYEEALQEIRRNKTVSGERADTILTLQDKLANAESALSGIQVRIQSAEKDSALLRQEFVALQIEREELKRQLSLAKIKLSDAQSKLRQIGILFNAVPEDGVQPAGRELKTESGVRGEFLPPEKPVMEGLEVQAGNIPEGTMKPPDGTEFLPSFPEGPPQEPPADSPGRTVKKPGKRVNVELEQQSAEVQ